MPQPKDWGIFLLKLYLYYERLRQIQKLSLTLHYDKIKKKSKILLRLA
ncbi:MAG: hypothetical protein RLZZ306_3074 [Bacteroidota bacterium]|jgi:hypothetical protein